MMSDDMRWKMAEKRRIEIFSAGCAVCTETIKAIEAMACPSCDVTVLDMNDADVAARARQLGVRSVPAILVDGRLADCCAVRGPDEASLRHAGIGQPIP
jgi:hypothetical protein